MNPTFGPRYGIAQPPATKLWLLAALVLVIIASCSGAEQDEQNTSLTHAPDLQRTVAESCDDQRPVPGLVDVKPEWSECVLHDDCDEGRNGRCSYEGGPGGEVPRSYCTYDECFADDDCQKGMICRCGSDDFASARLYAKDENRCVPSNCKTNADCVEGQWCKADPSPCGDGQIFGYFCTTPEDECRNDSDCGRSVCIKGEYDFFRCHGETCN